MNEFELMQRRIEILQKKLNQCKNNHQKIIEWGYLFTIKLLEDPLKSTVEIVLIKKELEKLIKILKEEIYL